jgi:hypothetical protein
LINRLKNKYDESPDWEQEIMEYEIKYNEEHSRKDQASITSTPQNGKFLKRGVTDDIALIDKGTNLVNGREKIDWFHWSHTTIEQAKGDLPERSLCLLFCTKNKIFQIGEIMSHRAAKENTEGCFVTYRVNVTYKLSEDIGEILANEKYKIISDPEHMEELPYDTLKDFEEEVKEYQEMLKDPNYKKGLEKGKNNMQLEIKKLLEINDLDSIKKKLKEISDSI